MKITVAPALAVGLILAKSVTKLLESVVKYVETSNLKNKASGL